VSEGPAITQSDEFGSLRDRLLSEKDPRKREKLISHLLHSIQTEWSEVFDRLSDEENPERMLRLLAGLNELIEQRKRSA
jgi:hypothetical protein